VSAHEEVDVAVVGAGPVGMTVAGLLARQGVGVSLIERRTHGLRAPAAHVLRHRARSVLALLGIDEEIGRAVPELAMDNITWCTTLTGPEVGRVDLRGREQAASGSVRPPWTNLSQSVLEPILAGGLANTNGVRLHRGVECRRVEQDSSGATVQVRNLDGTERAIEASWVVVADGAGSRIREQLDVELVGDGPLGHFFMIHFEADLTPWVRDRPGPIFWITHPQATGALIIHDLRKSHVFMTPKNGVPGEDEGLPTRLAAALNAPTDVRIHSVDSWTPYCQVVSNYRNRRIFLAGDAAHRFPPSGGLGLNTGILEAHNLAWKLALVIAGIAPESSLDSYDAECRPAAQANARVSLLNAVRLSMVDEVVGYHDDLASMQDRLARMSTSERAALSEAIEQQRGHFVDDGTPPGPPGSETVVRRPVSERFALWAPPSPRWSDLVREIARATGVQLELRHPATPQEPDATASLDAELTRPDGIVISELTHELPPERANAELLALRAKLAEAIGSAPTDAKGADAASRFSA
jgi:2,4-dichlorophenol 6-monooxygenase